MKTLLPLTLASSLLMVACGHSQDKSQIPVHHYQCESGAAIVATYPSTDLAMVRYKGSDYKMQIVVAASGSRYVGSELEWWTKSLDSKSEGMLLKHMDNDRAGDIIERCTESTHVF